MMRTVLLVAMLGSASSQVTGMLDPWTYADVSVCLQSYANYPALWAAMKGSGIDTGRPSGVMRHNTTCEGLGYTQKGHDLDNLPAVVRAGFVGVTEWKMPGAVTTSLATDLQVTGILDPWTYADASMCLQSYANYPALWTAMKGSGIDTGRPSGVMRHNTTCEALGYTVKSHDLDQLPAVIRAALIGVTAWKKPVSLGAVQASVTGLFSPWTYADPSACMQSYTNYPALWITMKGSGIDTGHPSGIMRHNVTCIDLGYSVKGHDLDNLPAVVRAVYIGVTEWKKHEEKKEILV